MAECAGTAKTPVRASPWLNSIHPAGDRCRHRIQVTLAFVATVPAILSGQVAMEAAEVCVFHDSQCVSRNHVTTTPTCRLALRPLPVFKPDPVAAGLFTFSARQLEILESDTDSGTYSNNSAVVSVRMSRDVAYADIQIGNFHLSRSGEGKRNKGEDESAINIVARFWPKDGVTVQVRHHCSRMGPNGFWNAPAVSWPRCRLPNPIGLQLREY